MDATRTDQPPSFERFVELEYRSLVGIAYLLSASWVTSLGAAAGTIDELRHRWPRLGSQDPSLLARHLLARRVTGARGRTRQALMGIAPGRGPSVPVLDPLADEVVAMIADLPDEQVPVMALTYWDQMSPEAISSIVDSTPAQVIAERKRGATGLHQGISSSWSLQHWTGGSRTPVQVIDWTMADIRRSLEGVDLPVGREARPRRVGLAVAAGLALALGLWQTVGADLAPPRPEFAASAMPAPSAEPVAELAEPEPESESEERSAVDPTFVAIEPDGKVIVDPGEAGGAIVPIMGGRSAWNADESLLLLYRRGGQYVVVDTERQLLVSSFTLDANDIEHVFWDPLHPGVLNYLSGNTVIEFDVHRTEERNRTTVETCDSLHPGVQGNQLVAIGEARRLGVVCDRLGDQAPILVGLDQGQVLVAGGQDNQALAGQALGISGPAVSPSGRSAFWQTTDGAAAIVDPISLIERHPTGIDNDAGFTTIDGVEYLVGIRYDGDTDEVGSLVIVDAGSGRQEVIVGPATGSSYPPSGLLAAVNKSGLVALAVPGDAETEAGDVLQPGRIYLVDLTTPNPQPIAVARHEVTTTNDDLSAWSGHHLSIADSGTRIVFSTDGGRDRVVTAVIDLEGAIEPLAALSYES